MRWLAAGALASLAALPLQLHAQTLAQALDQAWARAPQANAFAARAAEAEARAEVASGALPLPPSVSLSSLNDKLGSDQGRQEWELELALPLWLPGQRSAREGEAQSIAAEVAARRRALRLQLAGELRDAWWALAATRAAVSLAERRANTAAALEAEVQRRVKAGDLARVDGNLAQGERLAAQAELIEATGALRTAEQVWRHLTGNPPPANLAPEPPAGLTATATEAETAALRSAAATTATATASERRTAPVVLTPEDHPALASALAATRVAQAKLVVADATRRDAPELALRYFRERATYNDSQTNAIGIKLTVPFSSGARTRQESAALQAEVAQADGELAQARLGLALDAERAGLALEAARRQIGLARERRALGADTLRLVEKAFALGESGLPALLLARAAAYESEAALARQQIAADAAQSRLNQALGVLP
ncbi:MAG: TolC family protein [Rhizobacter sp.]|nr:TolC family protein [Rhizobacter sp.]